MLLKDVKQRFKDKSIDRATVYRVPRRSSPANGYEYKIVFRNRAGDGNFLTKQRGGARTFSNHGAVENVLLDVGVRFYSVIMLEYQIDSGIFQKFKRNENGEVCLEDVYLDEIYPDE